MRLPALRLLLALATLAFVAAACTGDTGSTWTYAPVTADADATTPADTEVEAATPVPPDAPVPAEPTPAATTPEATAPAEQPELVDQAEPETTEPAETTEPPTAPPADGEPRVVELESTASLLFLQDGERVPDIAVTPGETVMFRIDNTAGFGHNFYIGEDEVLSVPYATTDIGLPVWENGVQELEWQVPDDIAGLKFGCTVPGHYFTQQGTFSVGR